MKTLHIYGQEAWHDDVYVIGDIEALKELRDTIDKLLLTKESQESPTFFCGDGEGFSVRVMVATEEELDRVIALPYTGEYAKDTREVVWPELWFAQKKGKEHEDR